MSANKYLAYNLIKDLKDHIIRSYTNISNVCSVFNELQRLASNKKLLHDVKLMIATSCSEVCASDGFRQIEENALVAILKSNRLYIGELDLLKACLRWTDSEVERRHLKREEVDKRTVFGSIKHLIRFSDLNTFDFGSILNLKDYLTNEEIASIFIHICQPS